MELEADALADLVQALDVNKGPSGTEDVMRLVLRHSVSKTIYQEQNVLCKLLCASKGLRGAIVEHSDQQLLPVSLKAHSVQKAMQFSLWLQNHGLLVKTIELFSLPDRRSNAFAQSESLIAAAVADAATQGMQLQAFSTKDPSRSILAALPCKHLTRLELSAHLLDAAYLESMSTTINSLTGLQSLSLSSYSGDAINGVEPLIPTLSCFKNLTHLHLDSMCAMALHEDKGPFPEQLQSLYIRFNHCARQTWAGVNLNLGYLTALTELILDRDFLGHLSCEVGDVLPPNLRVLRMQSCAAVQPLLQLKGLQTLVLNASCTEPHEVQLLTSLTALSALQLLYPHHGGLNPTMAGWEVLPALRDLTLDMGYAMPCDFATQLAEHTGLTRLVIHSTDWDGTPQQLAAAVSSMVGLQELQLLFPRCVLYEWGPICEFGQPLQGMDALIKAVAGINTLKRLVFIQLGFTMEPAFRYKQQCNVGEEAVAFCRGELARHRSGANFGVGASSDSWLADLAVEWPQR